MNDETKIIEVECIVERKYNSSELRIMTQDSLIKHSQIISFYDQFAEAIENSGFWVEIQEGDTVFVHTVEEFTYPAFEIYPNAISLKTTTKTYLEKSKGLSIFNQHMNSRLDHANSVQTNALITLSVFGSIAFVLLAVFFISFFHYQKLLIKERKK